MEKLFQLEKGFRLSFKTISKATSSLCTLLWVILPFYATDSNAQGGSTSYGVSALPNPGTYNTAFGYFCMNSSTTGTRNTAVGYRALVSNETGSYNVALGKQAMSLNTAGSNNTAVGYEAMYSNRTGLNNTAIGHKADIYGDSLFNATAIGYGALVDASNRVRIGNFDVVSIGGHVGWTIFSDGRYKKDVKENIQGLAFINSLRPASYTIDIKGVNQYYHKGKKAVLDDEASDKIDEAANAAMRKAEDAAGKTVHNGFIAQEVEAAAKKLSFEFSGVDKPQTKDGLYGLRYDNFVVPLVKAVQELSKQNEDLQKQINELKAVNAANNNTGTSSLPSTSLKLSSAVLDQNTPNPLTNNTAVRYRIPPNAKSARLMITDQDGRTVKQITLSTQKGMVYIDASALSSGTYSYSLLVDGSVMESRTMTVVH